MCLLGKISVPLWRSPLSQTRKKSNLRSPSGKKEVRSHSSQEDILLIKWRVYTYVIRHRALLCLRYMVRDQENEGDGGKKWKKSTFLIPNLEASRRDQVPGKWGKCQIPLHLLLRTVEINPELDSANMEWFIFFFNNALLRVPSCPLAGKALQLSLSLFPCFWAGLFQLSSIREVY